MALPQYAEVALLLPKGEATRFNGSLLTLINSYRLTLPSLSGSTPLERTQLWLYDENIENVPFNTFRGDIVGISIMTPTAIRGYEIADYLRAQGKKIVLGGIHATVLPEEAAQHADSVVIGPGNAAWRMAVQDFIKGELKLVYDGFALEKETPRNERERVALNSRFSIAPIQTSEGCPYKCSFCSVRLINPGFVRYNLDDVIKELESVSGRNITFIDDNLWSDKRYAKELFRRMQGLGKRWISQAPLGIAQDGELLLLAQRSGCVGVYIGIDTIVEESIKAAKKRPFDVKKIPEYIRIIQDHGIFVEAGVIFGFDNEDKSVFERTLDFYARTSVDSLNFHILTPYPGTDLRAELEHQGRILHNQWKLYDTRHAVFKPAKMTPDELQEGYDMAWHQYFSWHGVLARVLRSGNPLASLGLHIAGKYSSNVIFDEGTLVTRMIKCVQTDYYFGNIGKVLKTERGQCERKTVDASIDPETRYWQRECGKCQRPGFGF